MPYKWCGKREVGRGSELTATPVGDIIRNLLIEI